MSSYGIYTSGLGAMGQAAKMDLIANNLANVATPGYRKDSLSFRQRLVRALEGPADLRYYNAKVDRNGGAPFVDQITFDSKPGGYQETQRPLDLAIMGQGFFTVTDLKTGTPVYTRAGNFSLAPDGRILTADGRYQLTSTEGNGLAAEPDAAGPIHVGRDGQLTQGDAPLGQVGLVDFDNYNQLRKLGDNVYQNEGASASAPTVSQILQGTLETSSVNPMTEMVEMIRTFRTLESNLQMIKIQDEVVDHSVNELGRPAK
jgi:flagellar basal-body rod protein FlgG